MATLSERLQTEIDRANTTTSKTDTTVHSAITSLIEGYGGGGELYFNISVSKISSNKTAETFKIYSNSDWSISADVDWLAFDVTTGTGDAEITITQTIGDDNRDGVITLTCGSIIKTILFTSIAVTLYDYIYVISQGGILTNYQFEKTDDLYFKGLCSSSSTTSAYYGQRTTASGYTNNTLNYGKTTYIKYGSTSNSVQFSTTTNEIELEALHTGHITVKSGTTVIVDASVSEPEYDIPVNLMIMGINTADSTSNRNAMPVGSRFNECKVTRDGNIIHHYYGAKKSGVVGIYDTITGEFFAPETGEYGTSSDTIDDSVANALLNM